MKNALPHVIVSLMQVLANSLGSAVFAALAAAAASKLIPQIIPQPALLTGFLVGVSRETSSAHPAADCLLYCLYRFRSVVSSPG